MLDVPNVRWRLDIERLSSIESASLDVQRMPARDVEIFRESFSGCKSSNNNFRRLSG